MAKPKERGKDRLHLRIDEEMNDRVIDAAAEQHEDFTTFVIKAIDARLKKVGFPGSAKPRPKPGRPKGT